MGTFYRSSRASANKDQLKNVFKKYSTIKTAEGKAGLGREDLKNAFEYLGALMPGYKAASALKYIDTDNSGWIADDELDALVEYAYASGYRG